MAENDRQRSTFLALVRHIWHCPHAEILLSPNHPHLVAKTARRRPAEFGDEAQKKQRRRAICQIARKITPLLTAVGLWVCAVACGPAVVDLGARGGGVADSGADAFVATSGAGGLSGDGAAGLSRAGAGGVDSGAGAIGGAGPGPGVADDAGMAAAPDAGLPESGPEPSTGCGVQPTTADTSITVNGSTAGYLVDLAADYDPNKPYPLVMSFRTAGVTIEAFRRDLGLPAVVGADGIVVTVDWANGADTWDLQRDPPVFEPLLAKLEASYCIDRRRIFVVGHETGAIFANVLACMHAGVLRGLGSISGVAPRGTCTGGLAVWISQGDADPTRMLGRESRDFWIQQNQCDATMTVPVSPSPCIAYVGCEMGNPVHYCEYDGNQDVPSFATTAVWNFFRGL
jgi:poly(3-hydroxybutyrate) depolymerase